MLAREKYEKTIATAAPINVENKRVSAVLLLIPGPMTISAVTGTFIDATSPKCNARATTEQSNTVVATAMKPKSK